MRKDLSDSEKFLLSHIASFKDGCYQLKMTIADELGWTLSKVQRILASLKKRGLVTWTFDGRKNHIRLYNNEQADYTKMNSPTQECTVRPSNSVSPEDTKMYPIEYTLEHTKNKRITTFAQSKPKINLNMETWGWEGITEKDRELWRQAYPAVNQEAELTAAALWIKNNPSRKKTAWGRYITNWFSRCQNRGGSKIQNTSTMNGSEKWCHKHQKTGIKYSVLAGGKLVWYCEECYRK